MQENASSPKCTFCVRNCLQSGQRSRISGLPFLLFYFYIYCFIIVIYVRPVVLLLLLLGYCLLLSV